MKNSDLEYLRTFCQMKRNHAGLVGEKATGGAEIQTKALQEAYNIVIKEIDAVINMRQGIIERASHTQAYE